MGLEPTTLYTLDRALYQHMYVRYARAWIIIAPSLSLKCTFCDCRLKEPFLRHCTNSYSSNYSHTHGKFLEHRPCSCTGGVCSSHAACSSAPIVHRLYRDSSRTVAYDVRPGALSGTLIRAYLKLLCTLVHGSCGSYTICLHGMRHGKPFWLHNTSMNISLQTYYTICMLYS